jgi:hypothetical protein
MAVRELVAFEQQWLARGFGERIGKQLGGELAGEKPGRINSPIFRLPAIFPTPREFPKSR